MFKSVTNYRLDKVEEKMSDLGNLPERVSQLEGKVSVLITINTIALVVSIATLSVLLIKQFG